MSNEHFPLAAPRLRTAGPPDGPASGGGDDEPPLAPIAAVISDGETDSDEVVVGFAVSQINRGRRIRGLVQEVQRESHDKHVMLIDLDGGRLYRITSALGASSVSCRLNTYTVADATAVMRRIAVIGADLAIFNRFSALEAQGEGFLDEMLDLMTRRIPVLTIVPRQHLAAWRTFTGGFAVELPPCREALEQWFAGICAAFPDGEGDQDVEV